MTIRRIKKSLEAHGLHVSEINRVGDISLGKPMIRVTGSEHQMYFISYREAYCFHKNLGFLEPCHLVRRS